MAHFFSSAAHETEGKVRVADEHAVFYAKKFVTNSVRGSLESKDISMCFKNEGSMQLDFSHKLSSIIKIY